MCTTWERRSRRRRVVVDPLDVDGIASGLAAVLTDDALRADLTRRGTAYAATRTWRGTARAHVELWRSLL